MALAAVAHSDRRLSSLDGLRAAAAGMIFLHHVRLPGLEWATAGMGSGVLIFFALSGYLIYLPFARAIARGSAVDLPSYALRRFLRIAPAYLVASFLIAALRYPWLLDDPFGLATSLNSSIVVVWTLQIEVQFYVLVPMIALLLRGFGSANRIRAILLLSTLSLLFTALVMATSLATMEYIWAPDISNAISYLWAFGAGMLVVELQVRGSLSRPVPLPIAFGGLGLIVLSLAVMPPKFLDIPATVGAAILIAFIVSRPSSLRLTPLFLAGGAISYSVYLWHEAIIDAVDRPATWGGAATAAILTVAVATVIYLLVERPAIRLGHRRTMTVAAVRPTVEEPA